MPNHKGVLFEIYEEKHPDTRFTSGYRDVETEMQKQRCRNNTIAWRFTNAACLRAQNVRGKLQQGAVFSEGKLPRMGLHENLFSGLVHVRFGDVLLVDFFIRFGVVVGICLQAALLMKCRVVQHQFNHHRKVVRSERRQPPDE